MVVAGRGRRLHDEDVGAAHVVVDLDEDLAVAEAADFRTAERYAEMRADRVGQCRAGVARKDLEQFIVSLPSSRAT